MAEDDTELLRQNISDALETDDQAGVAKLLTDSSVVEIANLLDSLPAQQREAIWPQINPAELGSVLLETGDELRDARLNDLEA